MSAYMFFVHVIHRQLEHAWLDLGVLDRNQLLQLGKDLSNASKMVLVTQTLMCSLCSLLLILFSITFPPSQVDAHQRFVKFSKALGKP